LRISEAVTSKRKVREHPMDNKLNEELLAIEKKRTIHNQNDLEKRNIAVHHISGRLEVSLSQFPKLVQFIL
jgi:hypothetical protein